jgi:peptidoglycan-associated lipoprotein
MKRILQTISVTLILLSGLVRVANAQYILKEADAAYGLFNYIKAIDLYEQAYKKKQTLYAAERLGSCYSLINDYKQAESWYALAAGMPSTDPANIMAYAGLLRQNSKYAEARVQYQKYIALKKDVSKEDQKIWLLSCDSAVIWMKHPSAVDISNKKEFNTPYSDWGAVPYGNGIVFASDRGTVASGGEHSGRPFLKFDGAKRPNPVIYGWTGNHYLRLFFKNRGADSVDIFPLDANTNYHVGPASFNRDGSEMYFALTRIPNKPVFSKGNLSTVNVEIYSSRKAVDGKWSLPMGFKYNKVAEYSVGDPFLTPDGNTLYFVSNMSGGMGGTDIYVSEKNSKGEWGLPLNLRDINTGGNERTPVIGGDQNITFSSDGRIGMGGLDIFESRLSAGKFGEPRNLGYPTNSPRDDFAYMPASATEGYFSSNRTEGMGNDDIYSFSRQPVPIFRLVGRALDKDDQHPLANAIVTLSKINGQVLKVLTDDSGDFSFNLERSSDYKLTGDKTGYRSDGSELTTKDLTVSAEIRRDLYLEKVNLGAAIKLENIYYDFNKSNIRPDAAVELDKLVKIMNNNPTIWIELGSHTDSRGNDRFNQWLSQSRANSAVQYIIDHGISKNRITAKGYGESQLINRCSNGVECSESEHQANRRTEFKITRQ